MKHTPIIAALLFGFSLFAQEGSAEPVKDKKIEVIKIIEGDTVMHTVRLIKKADFDQRCERRIHHSSMQGDMNLLDDEVKSMIKDMDIYVCADGIHKKMIVKQIGSDPKKLEDLLESMDSDEDLIVDFEDGRSKMKVMKIRINADDLDEITTIDLCIPKLDQHSEEGEEDRYKKGQKSSFKAYPNPAKDHVNIDFEVMEGNAVLIVKDVNGKVLFAKEYKEAGEYSEQVRLKGSKSKIIVVELNEKRRLETQKIIVD